MKEEYKTCPNCHNVVDERDKQCPYCLTPLTRRNTPGYYGDTKEYNQEIQNTEDNDTNNESANNETIRNDKQNTTSEGLLPLLRSLVNNKKGKKEDETIIIKAIIIICIFIMLGCVSFAYTFLQ